MAGILFALLFAASVTLIRTTIPDELAGGFDWVTSENTRLSVALFLMPLAGIAFLWFMGVIRDQMGEFEDRFFSTVFLGSGLLFLAMVFVAMAIVGGIMAGRAGDGRRSSSPMCTFSAGRSCCKSATCMLCAWPASS